MRKHTPRDIIFLWRLKWKFSWNRTHSCPLIILILFCWVTKSPGGHLQLRHGGYPPAPNLCPEGHVCWGSGGRGQRQLGRAERFLLVMIWGFLTEVAIILHNGSQEGEQGCRGHLCERLRGLCWSSLGSSVLSGFPRRCCETTSSGCTWLFRVGRTFVSFSTLTAFEFLVFSVIWEMSLLFRVKDLWEEEGEKVLWQKY